MKTAQQIGQDTLSRLAAQAERNRKSGAALLAKISAVLAAHPDPDRLSGRQVRALLVPPLPALRTVQQYRKILRAESSMLRAELNHDDSHEQPTHALAPSLRPAKELLVTATRPILSLRPRPQTEEEYHRQAPILQPTLQPPAFGAMPNRHSDAIVAETPAQRLAWMLQRLGPQR